MGLCQTKNDHEFYSIHPVKLEINVIDSDELYECKLSS